MFYCLFDYVGCNNWRGLFYGYVIEMLFKDCCKFRLVDSVELIVCDFLSDFGNVVI